MRKMLMLILVAVMVISLSTTTALAEGSTGDKAASSSVIDDTEGTGADDESADTTGIDSSDDSEASNQHGNKPQDTKNQFKTELNEQKKELQQEKSDIAEQLEALEAEYEALIDAGDTEGAEELQADIDNLKAQKDALQAQIKQTINERYMIVKAMYTDEEMAQFESASDLIAQMYEDANVLDAGCVTVNNNLIKFDAPAYIKGGTTLVPLRAISEELDCEVSWDADTQTVTISDEDTVIEITANSTTVLVDGTPVEITTPAAISCGRTYIPLRFLAEALDFEVSWDSENELIDIEGDTADAETAADLTDAA